MLLVLLESVTTIGLTFGEIIAAVLAIGSAIGFFYLQKVDVAKSNVEISNMKEQAKRDRDEIESIKQKVDSNMNIVRDEMGEISASNRDDHNRILDKIDSNHKIVMEFLLKISNNKNG